MQVDTYNKQEVITSPGFEVNSMDFGVKNPALIFDILCNRMYQNPVRTMIQEYMSNARDAHREIGKDDTPIEVTLPTYLDNTLRIRDFGPGLTPERIEDVFVFLGESTKRADNIQTGGFGVGAKVGWAYSDSFTVVSIVEGVERVYLAFLGTENVGKLSLISTKNTTDAQGVEIQITIKKEDITSVMRGVQHVCHFWEVPPIIHNATETITFYTGPRNEPVLLDVPNCSEKALAVVDGIPYPLDATSAVHLKDINIPYNSYLTACLFFNTGDIDLAVNREGLRYSDKTITAISMHIDECAEKTERLIEQAKQHVLLKDKIIDMMDIFKGIVTTSELVTNLDDNAPDDAPRVRLVCQYAKATLRFSSHCDIEVFKAFSNSQVQTGISTKRLQRSSYATTAISIDPEKVYCVVHDANSPSKARLRTLFATHNIDRTVVIITSSKYVYSLLVKGGLIDLNTLQKTKASASTGGMGYADTDVKLVLDRYLTITMRDLDKTKHCYCTFKECADVREKMRTFKCSRYGYKVYYVTVDQLAYVKEAGIPHVNEIFEAMYRKQCAEVYYKEQLHTKNILTESWSLPYSCRTGASDLIYTLRDCADDRFGEIYDKAIVYNNMRTIVSDLEKVNSMSLLLFKRAYKRRRIYAAKIRAMERELKQLVIILYKTYPLFAYVSTYGMKDEILNELLVYVNGKNGKC